MDITYKQAWDKEQVLFVLCQFARQVDYGVIIVDPQHDFNIAYTNNVMTTMTGYQSNEFINSKLSILYGPLTSEENIKSLEDSLKYSMVYKMAMFSYRKNRSAFWNEMNCLPIRDVEGRVAYYYVICRDITNVIHTENVVRLERDVYEAIEDGKTLKYIFDKICNDIALTFKRTCHCSIFLFTDEKIQLAGYGQVPAKLYIDTKKIPIDALLTDQAFFSLLKKSWVSHNFYTYLQNKELQQFLKQSNIGTFWSQPIFSQDHAVIGTFSLVFEDDVAPDMNDYYYLDRIGPIILLALKYTEQKNEIRQLAYYDSKTNLPNLALFQNIVKKLNVVGTLYIFEPGEFHNIIDVYGRDGGDELLKQLADRIKNLERFDYAIIARYTSSALIKALPGAELSTSTLRNHLNALTLEPYTVKGKQVYITLKIGTSKLQGYSKLNIAIQQADTALSAALKNVGTVIHTFNPTHVESTEERMTVLGNITKALQQDEFFPMLQPKVNIHTGEITSFEALARWVSPELGYVSPAVFIPVAEDTGNIHRIDRAILKKVLRWQQARKKDGKRLFQISVNISPPHFYYPTFVEDVIQLIQQYEVDCRYIKFEITESIELENVMRAKKIINELQMHGIETAIDDFGVGYSSLSYLQELPFDEIKIDKSFIDHLQNRRMNAIVKTLVQLANDLQMKAVAEGIETEEQHEMIKQLGCVCGQGYYYYKPMQLHDIDLLLENEMIYQ